MNNLFRATVSGRLTDTPKLRTTEKGRPMADADVAINRRRRNSAGEWEDAPTTFLKVRAFDALAENLADLDKGSPVTLTGDVVTDEWVNQREETVRSLKLLAENGGTDLSARKPDASARQD